MDGDEDDCRPALREQGLDDGHELPGRLLPICSSLFCRDFYCEQTLKAVHTKQCGIIHCPLNYLGQFT